MLVILAEAATLSDAVRGYLMIAAGAAFLDRVAEGFVGREGLSFELGGLWLSSALAGTGLLVSGLSLIGLPLPWLGGLHLALMGGLGLVCCRFSRLQACSIPANRCAFRRQPGWRSSFWSCRCFSGSSRNSRHPSPCPSALTV